ncbi:MAG: aminoacyl-tRNA hydrolase [Alcanivorax sp.]|nr:aminoacyl-tRNA hydrolase [Alcanivorax sp.]MEE2767546.1 aminoacyl-tRNA hydrolase [Pseudomonadota bacterium]
MVDYFLVVGLGNPSGRYEETRHNAGFWFVDKLAADAGGVFCTENRFSGLVARVACADRTLLLLKPLTYMNRSGQSVGAIARYFKIPATNILITHDDLDFEPGTVRLKLGGGHGGHNGIRDVLAGLGTRDFMRLRLGIGHPVDRAQTLDYVLGRPSGKDRKAINAAIGSAVGRMPEITSGRVVEAMNGLHSR